MMARLLGALIVLVACVGPASSRMSGPLAWLGFFGGSASPERTLESVAAHIRGKPATAGQSVLALAATDVGHWRLVNSAGEQFTASGPLELERALKTLAPESQGLPERLVLYLTEETVFRFRTLVFHLPEKAALRVLLAGADLRVVRLGDATEHRLAIEMRPRQLAEAGDRQVMIDTLKLLRRPLDRSRIRTLALEAGGPTSIATVGRPDPTSRRAVADAVDPSHLGVALRSLAGQTVMVTGRVEDGRLVYKPASGPEGSLALTEIEAAADRADVNLLILGTSSTRQPGTRNWLWQRIELSHIDRAIERTTLGEFLDALAGEPVRTSMVASRSLAGRGEIEIKPLRRSGIGTLDIISDVVSGTWTDIVSETAGRVHVTTVRASMTSADRQRELDRRLVAGIPSVLQLGYLVVVAAGLIALPTLFAWWRRLWPPELPSDYGNRTGYVLARMVRFLAFGLLFVPLAGLPALAITIANALSRLAGRTLKLLHRSVSQT